MNISDLDFVSEYILLDGIDSTNVYAKSLDKDSISSDGLTVIRAKRQSDGRGRKTNAFFSDHEGGLWASIVTPITDISAHFRYNRAISLAILESLKRDDASPVTIKWPNDIYYGDKKIAGVLLENILDNPDALIVGFGVNVNMGIEDFPKNLQESVTSTQMETGVESPLDELFADILKRYAQYIDGASDESAAHLSYSRNLYKKGEKAAIDGQEGVFVTVDPDGRMRLETDRGHVLFSTGSLLFT